MSVWNRSARPEAFAQYGGMLVRQTCTGTPGPSGSWRDFPDETVREIVRTVEFFKAAGIRGFINEAADFHKLKPTVVHQIMAEYRKP